MSVTMTDTIMSRKQRPLQIQGGRDLVQRRSLHSHCRGGGWEEHRSGMLRESQESHHQVLDVSSTWKLLTNPHSLNYQCSHLPGITAGEIKLLLSLLSLQSVPHCLTLMESSGNPAGMET